MAGKLHAVVAGCLPVPVTLLAADAAQHDLPAAKQIIEDYASLKPGKLLADKAYIVTDWAQSLKQNHALLLLTPRKKHKHDVLRSGDTFSSFVSSMRQPVECFFNWLNRLTDIQTASLVRSLSGLLCHLFGRIAAALAMLLFNP